MNGFLIFDTVDALERFQESSDAERLRAHSTISSSTTRPMLIVQSLDEDMLDTVERTARRWNARFERSRRYEPVKAGMF